MDRSINLEKLFLNQLFRLILGDLKITQHITKGKIVKGGMHSSLLNFVPHHVLLALLIGITAFFSSCSITRHLEEGQYLIKNEVKVRKGVIQKRDSVTRRVTQFKEKGSSGLEDAGVAFRTKPNRRWLIPKTYLMLYNSGKSLTTYEYPFERAYRKFADVFSFEPALVDTVGNFLMKIGEEPYLLDSNQLDQDVKNLKSIYFSNGWFNPSIYYEVDTILLKKKKANIKVLVQENQRWRIGEIKYDITSPKVKKAEKQTRNKSLLKEGGFYNEEALEEERLRIATVMREAGLYKFNPGMIRYLVDTVNIDSLCAPVDSNRVPKKTCLKLTVKIDEEPQLYTIRNITLRVEPAIWNKENKLPTFKSDTLTEKGRAMLNINPRFLEHKHDEIFKIHPQTLGRLDLDFLVEHIEFYPGQVYSLRNERKTQREMQSFGIFRYSQVRCTPIDSLGQLDVEISSKMLKRYQFKVGAEGFSQTDPVLNSNLPGFGGSFSLKDNNLFKRGEKLDLSLKGDVSFYRLNPDTTLSLFSEFGADATLRIPFMLVPFVKKEEMIQFSPSTNFSTKFQYQRRAEFTRTTLGMNWNYSWFHDPKYQYLRSSISPLIVDFLRSETQPQFQQAIEDLGQEDPALRALIEQNYQSLFSTRFQYKFTSSNYRSTKNKPTHYIQPTFGMGGNLAQWVDQFLIQDTDGSDDKIERINDRTGDTTDIIYGRYLKLNFEFKEFIPLGQNMELVVRTNLGTVRPCLGSKIVPFNSRYFIGGINSLRGWQSNTLGPGTFNRDSLSVEAADQYEYLISPGGEIMVEANAELRMHFGQYLELATFTDVGNVWFFPDDEVEEELQNGRLTRENFKLGWDGGIGIRADFSFFILRFDWGFRLYSPDVQKYVWNKEFKSLGRRRNQINFGIGYPF